MSAVRQRLEATPMVVENSAAMVLAFSGIARALPRRAFPRQLDADDAFSVMQNWLEVGS